MAMGTTERPVLHIPCDACGAQLRFTMPAFASEARECTVRVECKGCHVRLRVRVQAPLSV